MLGSRDYGITGKDNTVPRVGIRSMQHPEGRAAAMAARPTSRVGQKWWPQFAFKYISLLPQFFPLTFSKLQEVLFWPGSRRQDVHGEEMLQSALVFQHA